ncbi:MAG TPA: hypothetical protein VF698_17675 [Thermoanaerobaculia bacterium]|jgi:hypothetical protein
MGILLPITLFFLLRLETANQFLTIALATFFAWSVTDILATILSKPRLRDRSPGKAIGEEWERRSHE